MKTFIYCTSYFDSEEVYRERYQKWIDYYNDHPFTKDKHMYLIDDGSDLDLLTDDRVHVIQEDQLGSSAVSLSAKLNLYSFRERKGLNCHRSPDRGAAGNKTNNEGWWRSYITALNIAKEYDYDKFIHIESDAYLISKRVLDYVDSLKGGWTAFWCPRYVMPEASLQVICKDAFTAFEGFTSCGYEALAKKGIAERVLPFTHVATKFNGDRYGEIMGDVDEQIRHLRLQDRYWVRNKVNSEGIDYFCQCNLDTIISPDCESG